MECVGKWEVHGSTSEIYFCKQFLTKHIKGEQPNDLSLHIIPIIPTFTHALLNTVPRSNEISLQTFRHFPQQNLMSLSNVSCYCNFGIVGTWSKYTTTNTTSHSRPLHNYNPSILVVDIDGFTQIGFSHNKNYYPNIILCLRTHRCTTW